MINTYKKTNDIIDTKINNKGITNTEIHNFLSNTKNKVIKILKLDVNDLFKKSITWVNKKTDEIIVKIKGTDWKTKVAIGGTLLVAPGGFIIASVLGGKLVHDYIKSKNEK